MPVFASVTAGTACPAAIYVVCTIYTPTNNDVPIQYLHQLSNQKNYHTHHCVSSKFFTLIIPVGGDTPFYLISRRNQRFLFDG